MANVCVFSQHSNNIEEIKNIYNVIKNYLFFVYNFVISLVSLSLSLLKYMAEINRSCLESSDKLENSLIPFVSAN